MPINIRHLFEGLLGFLRLCSGQVLRLRSLRACLRLPFGLELMAERRGRSDSRRALRVELRVETSEPKAGQVVRNDIVCSAPALSGAFSSEASSDATKNKCRFFAKAQNDIRTTRFVRLTSPLPFWVNPLLRGEGWDEVILTNPVRQNSFILS